MISRRSLLGGIGGLATPVLTGCASRRSLAPARAIAEAAPAAGLDAVIDLSHNVAVTDLALAKRRNNILGVIHKASEGGDWIDLAYAERRAMAEAAGMLWGAYHFGTHQYSGAEQAAAFLAAARPGPTTLMALDLEPNELNLANTMNLSQAEAFVEAVYRSTGRLPLVYTHPIWANGEAYGRFRISLDRAVDSRSILARCDLWLADYRDQPELPLAWARRGRRLWQYAGDENGDRGGALGPLSRAVAGVEKCDRNLFAGDAAALYRYWNRGGGTA